MDQATAPRRTMAQSNSLAQSLPAELLMCIFMAVASISIVSPCFPAFGSLSGFSFSNFSTLGLPEDVSPLWPQDLVIFMMVCHHWFSVGKRILRCEVRIADMDRLRLIEQRILNPGATTSIIRRLLCVLECLTPDSAWHINVLLHILTRCDGLITLHIKSSIRASQLTKFIPPSLEYLHLDVSGTMTASCVNLPWLSTLSLVVPWDGGPLETTDWVLPRLEALLIWSWSWHAERLDWLERMLMSVPTKLSMAVDGIDPDVLRGSLSTAGKVTRLSCPLHFVVGEDWPIQVEELFVGFHHAHAYEELGDLFWLGESVLQCCPDLRVMQLACEIPLCGEGVWGLDEEWQRWMELERRWAERDLMVEHMGFGRYFNVLEWFTEADGDVEYSWN